MPGEEIIKPRTIEIRPSEKMPLELGKPILVGSDPEKATYLDPKVLNQCGKVKLNIDPRMKDYLPRGAFLMLRAGEQTTVAIPYENQINLTLSDTNRIIRTISPGDKTEFDDGKLETIIMDLNGRKIQLRFVETVGKTQFFRLEVDPT